MSYSFSNVDEYERFARRVHVVQEHERRQAYHDRQDDQSDQRFFHRNSYYGIRNVNRVSNYQVLGVVLLIVLVGNILLFFIRLSKVRYKHEQERLQSIRNNRVYRTVRTQVLEDESQNKQKIRDRIIKS